MAVLIIGVIVFIGLSAFFLLKKKSQNPSEIMINRLSALVDISGADSSTTDISADSPPVNLRILFNFDEMGAAFIPHPQSLNHFQCDQGIVTYHPEQSTIDFTLSSPEQSQIFTMSFGFFYNKEDGHHKAFNLSYLDPISGATYRTKVNYESVKILPEGKSLAIATVDFSDNPFLLTTPTMFTLNSSSNINDVERICLYNIFAFELLPTNDLDEYGSPLWPIINQISGSFGP